MKKYRVRPGSVADRTMTVIGKMDRQPWATKGENVMRTERFNALAGAVLLLLFIVITGLGNHLIDGL